MSNDHDMLSKLIGFGAADPRIRFMTLEGSRTNRNVPRDQLQDFDVSYFVVQRDNFLRDDQWLDSFGNRLMMQKPEDMELFPPDLKIGFSYIMLLADGSKLDLKIFSLEEIDDYFLQSDGLVQVLLDKDARMTREVVPSDRQYWIGKPSPRAFDDCCNEYWMVSTYVTKGLLRREFLFAVDYLHNILRPNLMRMMSWMIGTERGFDFSVGKHYKYIMHYLCSADWQLLQKTYATPDLLTLECATSICHDLFRKYSRGVAERLGFIVPDYEAAVIQYTHALKARLTDLSVK